MEIADKEYPDAQLNVPEVSEDSPKQHKNTAPTEGGDAWLLKEAHELTSGTIGRQPRGAAS